MKKIVAIYILVFFVVLLAAIKKNIPSTVESAVARCMVDDMFRRSMLCLSERELEDLARNLKDFGTKEIYILSSRESCEAGDFKNYKKLTPEQKNALLASLLRLSIKSEYLSPKIRYIGASQIIEAGYIVGGVTYIKTSEKSDPMKLIYLDSRFRVEFKNGGAENSLFELVKDFSNLGVSFYSPELEELLYSIKNGA